MNPFSQYLSEVRSALEAGNATEHTHRPALKALLESVEADVLATNEPKRIRCGAPDFILTNKGTPLGYVEAKDVGVSLDSVLSTDQLRRYLDALGNLLVTDYLEFRWFVGGEHRQTVRLADISKGKLVPNARGAEELGELLKAFLTADGPTVSSPRELAERMAHMARLIREAIRRAFQDEDRGGMLHHQMVGFQQSLLHDLTEEQFSDMYAQTICYGLFAARCNSRPGVPFARRDAAYDLPKTNPFLRKMFSHIAGPDLDDRIVWAVDDLAHLLARADMELILARFGMRTRQEDPVVHFYETFLAAYDPAMREARGVYYTPEPVVSYLVRSVNQILVSDFGLAEGLAHSGKITLRSPDGAKTKEVHKVQILDPATGTGTFLHGVIDHIHATFRGKEGMWSGYVRDHLLPRLFGFELLMAPYAVAHMKLGLQLKQTGYDFQSDERLGVYLTNSLEEAIPAVGANLFAQWVVEEANAAGKVKTDSPVMVVLGNPPYSGHSANKGEWIAGLLRGIDSLTGSPTSNYFEVDGKPLGERNPKWLNDDYVKFIRFAQWRIEQTGYGVLAFITNHGYLDNPTFRGMRQSLMETFDDLYLLNLHGNSKKKERGPDGEKEENVFDIQQGVAIGIFVKHRDGHKDVAKVRHADMWGTRESKYQRLWDIDVETTDWEELQPSAPHYLFVPQNTNLLVEYEKGWKVTDIFPVNSAGIVTARDEFTICWSESDVWQKVTHFLSIPAEEARVRYSLGVDTRDWKVTLAQNDIRSSGPDISHTESILYRPFDKRYTYFTGVTRGFHCMPRSEVMRHLLTKPNISLSIGRSGAVTGEKIWDLLFVGNSLIDFNLFRRGGELVFPLYLYAEEKIETHLFVHEEKQTYAPGIRRPNLAPAFITDFSARLGMTFVPDGKGDRVHTFGPEDVFAYIYAVLHAPSYRTRYAEFLKMDFPRVPLTGNTELFRALCGIGDKLVGLHLLEWIGPNKPNYPVPGSNRVDAAPRYSEPDTAGTPGRVWINNKQYFEGIPPEVWEFHVGGYQVCAKWLKDRKGRTLTYDDLEHYRQTVAALAETIQLMEAVDVEIGAVGGWPLL